MDFDALIQDIQKNNWKVHGLELYENDRLIHHYGNTTDGRFPIYSATKTMVSIAAGIACDRGKFDLEKSVLTYLPSKIIHQMSESQRTAYQAVTIERLMTMSVDGYPFRPEGESYLQYSLSCPLPDVRTKVFHYTNISAYLVGVALTEALQEDLFQFLNRNLFVPLHITEPVYQRCPDGYFYGASGMEMPVHDLSRVGMLLAHNGVYENERILSEKYVKTATGIRQMNREGGYGYFIWKYRYGFRISGKWGQRCYVLPERGLIISHLSHMEEDSHKLTESMERHLLGIG